ncbi:MAG: hypothetical protein AMXMBFR36_37850 [Acidobacteriota bacterium]
MPFPYYARLSARDKKTYRASDAIASVELPDAENLRPLVVELGRALAAEERRAVEAACRRIADGVCARLAVPAVRVRVLSARPTGDYGELHGLYEPEPPPARITLWMRTAARRRVVAFRSFLRTLVHELLHHLDYELYRFEETFHTEGFFQRESSLARLLLGEPPPEATPRRTRR